MRQYIVYSVVLQFMGAQDRGMGVLDYMTKTYVASQVQTYSRRSCIYDIHVQSYTYYNIQTHM